MKDYLNNFRSTNSEGNCSNCSYYSLNSNLVNHYECTHHNVFALKKHEQQYVCDNFVEIEKIETDEHKALWDAIKDLREYLNTLAQMYIPKSSILTDKAYDDMAYTIGLKLLRYIRDTLKNDNIATIHETKNPIEFYKNIEKIMKGEI